MEFFTKVINGQERKRVCKNGINYDLKEISECDLSEKCQHEINDCLNCDEWQNEEIENN